MSSGVCDSALAAADFSAPSDFGSDSVLDEADAASAPVSPSLSGACDSALAAAAFSSSVDVGSANVLAAADAASEPVCPELLATISPFVEPYAHRGRESDTPRFPQGT
ncbi:hypothetical protein DKM19_34755 [Streptosporangium sp. 'caverna']|nr:hypothetical protein DKM19_34755 [Streptosporangium sp. 'caverna']